MIKISPSVLAADFSKLGEEIKKIEKAGADLVHVDIMDGMFVPNISFGMPVLKAIKACTAIPLDVHLMIEKPERYIDEIRALGADIITVHAEATKHLHRVVQSIRSTGAKAGVALNPGTSPSEIEYVIDEADMILVMTVNPGFGGQGFIEKMCDKVKKVREAVGPDKDIEVDGGISAANIEKVAKAGANVFVAGSAIFNAKSAEEEINKMKRQAAKA